MLPLLRFKPKFSSSFSIRKPFKTIKIPLIPCIPHSFPSNPFKSLHDISLYPLKSSIPNSIESKRWSSSDSFQPKKEEEKKQYDPSINLQKYLRKFFLRVHPDLYNKFPEMQTSNQKNLSELNRLVAFTKAKKNPSNETKNVLLEKFPKKSTLHFFFSPTSDIKIEKIQEAKVEIDLEVIETKAIEERRADFTYKLYDGLYTLFKDSGIEVPEGDRWDSEGSFRKTEKERKVREVRWATFRSDKMSSSDVDKEIKSEMWYEKRRNVQLRLWETDELVNLEESRIDLDIVYYSPELNQKERERALEHLKSLVVVLDQNMFFWSDMPIMFTKDSWTGEKEGKVEGDGIIYIPFSFEEKDLVEHMKNNINKIREQRASQRNNMISVAEARTEILDSLELSEIGLHKSIPASKLSVCFEKLRKPEVMVQLAKFILKDLNIYIGPNEKGYSIIPHLNGFRIPVDFEIEKVVQLLKEADLESLSAKSKRGRIHLENLSKETFVLLDIFGCKPYFSPQLFEALSKEEQIETMSRLKKIALKLQLTRQMEKDLTIGDKFEEGEDHLEVPFDINRDEVHFLLKNGESQAYLLQEMREKLKIVPQPIKFQTKPSAP